MTNTLGIGRAQVETFVEHRKSLGLIGRAEQVNMGGQQVWGRVLDDWSEFYGGVPRELQPEGSMLERVHQHMELWRDSGLLIPDYQVVEVEDDVAVFTEHIDAVNLNAAPAESLGEMGVSLSKAILGNDRVRPALAALMDDNFVFGANRDGQRGMYMVDVDPYIYSKDAPIGSYLLSRFIENVTSMLCDSAGTPASGREDRKAAVNPFIIDFFRKLDDLPNGTSMEVVAAQSRALIYRDTGLKT